MEKQQSLFDRTCWKIVNIFSPESSGDPEADKKADRKRVKLGYIVMGVGVILTIIRLVFAYQKHYGH